MATIKSMGIFVLLFILFYMGIFYFISDNASTAGISVDKKYNDTFIRLNENKGKLNDLGSDIKSLIGGVDEAKAGEFGFFGLRGVLGIIRSPKVMVDITQSVFYSAIGVNEFIPKYVMDIISVMVMFTMIFAIIAFITQRAKEP